MNKEYAIEILETVERKTLESNCSLANEAYNYLMKLKSVQKNDSLMDRIYNAKHKSQY
jgi:hypothetical protein